jgi:hypothetical protein
MTPKRSVITAYHEHCEEYFKQTVYSDDCGTWMKSSLRFPSCITTIYPGSFLQYRNMLMHPRWEEYEYETMDENPLAFMGNGMTEADLNMAGDFAPYMDLRREWLELSEFLDRKDAESCGNGQANGHANGYANGV